MQPAQTAQSAQPRFPFTSFPSGWFVVATSEELVAGEILKLRYFGRDLVAFRGDDGEARVVDAYCPHLGAHLGHGGTVEGNCIRCPFHGWKFDGEGRCVEVPYAERIPPKAAIDAWVVREQDGLIHVFHGRPGEQPFELPALETEGWTEARMIHWRNLATHPQEVFENTVDITHIGPVHDGRGARLMHKPEREGPKLLINLEFDAPGDIVGMPEQLNDVHLEVTLRGLGWVVVHTHVRNVDIRARQRLYATPVDEDHIDIRGLVHVREQDDPTFTEELHELFYRAYCEDFAKDFPIWENKRYLTRPLLAKGDGPVGIYRRWCRQFYPEADAVEPASEPSTASEPAARPDVVIEPSGRGGLLRRLFARRRTVQPDRAGPTAEDDGDEWVNPSAGKSSTAPSASPSVDPVAGGGSRVASAQEYFETLEQRFVPAAAKGVDAAYQWELSGAGGRTFHAVVRDGRVDVHDGPHPSPTVCLSMGASDYVQVVNGDIDGMRAFTSGKGKVKGSIRAAMKMRGIFPAAG